MSTIFSPSACSWKPSNPWGKCFSHSKRKSAIEKDEHQAGTAVKGVVLARRNKSFWWHTSICSLLHFSKRCHAFRYFKISMQFSQGTPLSSVPADWFAWPPFSVKWRCSTCQAFFWEVLIAQRESDWERSIQFALIMRQLDRDTTAITLRGI